MTTTGYVAIRNKQTALLRKAVDGGVHLADYSADALALTDLFSATTGALDALPTGYSDLGYLTTDGVKFSRSVTTAGVQSWQSVDKTRLDITADTVTAQFACQETNVNTLALFYGADAADIATTPNAGGAIVIEKPTVPQVRYYRLAAFGVDGQGDSEIDYVRFFPRAVLSTYTDQALQNGTTPTLYGVTFQATVDDVLGYSEAVFFGGPGWLSLLDSMGFTAGGDGLSSRRTRKSANRRDIHPRRKDAGTDGDAALTAVGEN